MTARLSVGWDDDPVVASRAPLPALVEHVEADACVVGLGASGLAAVDELSDRGLSVVGLDAGRVGAGAAGRNGGFLLGGGAPFLHDAIERWGKEDAVALYRATLAEIDRVTERLGGEVIIRSGSIRLAGLPGEPRNEREAEDRERELLDCVAHRKALETNGIAVEAYDGELGQGLFLPDDASMNPATRVLELAGLVASRATLYEQSEVTSISPGRVDTAAGSVRAPLVVVAVDGALEQVLPVLAGRVRTARLQMLSTAPLAPGRLPCPVYGRWGYDFAQQNSEGRFYVGGGRDSQGDDEWTLNTEPTEPVQDEIEQIARRMAGREVEVATRWGASVSFTEDRRAVCAQVDDSVFACGGYSGTGNLVGPVAARAAVAYALDGVVPPGYFSH